MRLMSSRALNLAKKILVMREICSLKLKSYWASFSLVYSVIVQEFVIRLAIVWSFYHFLVRIGGRLSLYSSLQFLPRIWVDVMGCDTLFSFYDVKDFNEIIMCHLIVSCFIFEWNTYFWYKKIDNSSDSWN